MGQEDREDMAKKCKMVRTVTGEKANETVAKKDGKVRLVQFMAPWCGACQETKIEIDKANRELCGDGVETVRIDTDNNSDLADKYDIEDLPTVVAVKNGKVVGSVSGSEDVKVYVNLARKALGKKK